MKRTEDGWQSSDLGRTATLANLELKKVFIAAREYGIDVSPESFIDECWQGGFAAYQNAKKAWLEGDDAKAAQFVVYAAACAGMATRDSEKLQHELHSKAGKKAKGKPKPTRRNPLREKVQNAMRADSRSGRSFKEFMQSWESASIDGLVCKQAGGKYRIEDDAPENAAPSCSYTWGTLKAYYSSAS